MPTVNKYLKLSLLLLFVLAVVIVPLYIYRKYSVKAPVDVNVATPSGSVVLSLVKLTADPIAPGARVKYAVRVTNNTSLNVSAVGFTLNITQPIYTWANGSGIPTTLEVKEWVLDSTKTKLSFIAATKGSFPIANGTEIATVEIVAPSSAGTFNSVITKVTTAALPSIIDANGNEVMSSSSLAAANLTVTNPNPKPIGAFDSISCQLIQGWACDGSDYSKPLQINIYADSNGGGTPATIGTANVSRPDVASSCGSNPAHGFKIDFPASLIDGKPHAIYPWAIDIPNADPNSVLSPAPKSITCYPAPATPTNFKATCSTDGTQVTLAWSALSGASKYFLRNDNTSNGWPNGAGDYYDDNVTTVTKTVAITPNAPYHAWVHGVSSTGAVGPQADLTFTCVPNAGPAIGSLSIKGTTITKDDQLYLTYNENLDFKVSGITDSDGIKKVEFYRNETSALLSVGTLSTSGVYGFTYNNIPLGKYTLKVVVTDTKDVSTTKLFNMFYVRPTAVSISPNGGTFATLPNITVTNPNPASTVVYYAFCSTDSECNSITSTSVYSAPVLARDGYRFVAYVLDPALGTLGGRAYTLPFVKQTNAGPAMGSLSVKGVTLTSDDQAKLVYNETVPILVSGVTDTDGISSVTFYRVEDNSVLSTVTTGSSGTYSFNYKTVKLGKFTIKVVATDAKGATSNKTFNYFYVRPTAVTITPNGGTYATMPSVTITNPNPAGSTVLYDFCTTDCATRIIDASKIYTSPFTAKSEYSVVAYVNDSATGTSGGRVYTPLFNQQINVANPVLSLPAGNYLYDRTAPLTNKSITITTTSTGATINYCLASVLTATSCSPYSVYSSPILVNKNFKLFTYASKSGATNSTTVTAVYKLLGDVNSDGKYDLAGDILPTLNAIFESTLKTALMDVDSNGVVDLRDLVKILALMFS